MSYFMAKMHQIQFWLGLCPKPLARGAHSTPPVPLAGFIGSYFEGGEDESEGEGRVFSLYLSICGLQKGPGKFLMGVLECPGKVVDFFVSKRVGTLHYDMRYLVVVSFLMQCGLCDCGVLLSWHQIFFMLWRSFVCQLLRGAKARQIYKLCIYCLSLQSCTVIEVWELFNKLVSMVLRVLSCTGGFHKYRIHETSFTVFLQYVSVLFTSSDSFAVFTI